MLLYFFLSVLVNEVLRKALRLNELSFRPCSSEVRLTIEDLL